MLKGTSRIQVMEILIGGTIKKRSFFNQKEYTKVANVQGWHTKLFEVDSDFNPLRSSHTYIDITELDRVLMRKLRNIKANIRINNYRDDIKIYIDTEIANGLQKEKKSITKHINKFNTDGLYVLRLVGVESTSKIYMEILEVDYTVESKIKRQFAEDCNFISEDRFCKINAIIGSYLKPVYRTVIR